MRSVALSRRFAGGTLGSALAACIAALSLAGCPSPRASHRIDPRLAGATATDRPRSIEDQFPALDLHGPFPPPALDDTTADPADAVAYFQLGVRTMDTASGLADRAFYWATQINPFFPEAYYARWVLRRRTPFRLPSDSVTPERRVASRRATDSLRILAMEYNPFVDDGVEFRHVVAHPEGAVRLSRDPVIAAGQAYAQRDYRGAVRLWAEAIRKHPDIVMMHLPRSYAFQRLDETDSAIAELSTIAARIEKLERDSTTRGYFSKEQFYYAIGILETQRGRVAQAREAFEHALAENLGFSMAHVRLAAVALSENDSATALTELATASAIRADDPFVATFYGSLLLGLHRLPEAEAQLLLATKLAPRYALPHFFLGQLRDEQHDDHRARAAFQRFLELAARTSTERPWVVARLARPAGG